ncbi:MAG: ABC transporter ATP-binding protein [Raoultibacter sp.]|jgi:energy-coupling factor transporter ATP-binding protein EcfA2
MILFEDVSYFYDNDEDRDASISNLDFSIARGECVVLCGSSGCGKTTITRLINGLIPHHYEGKLSGNVWVDGKKIAEQSLAASSLTVGSVFQNPRSQFFNVNTTDELAFGCENQALPPEQIRDRIGEVSSLFSLDELLDRSIFELSGGEKQRIACASVYATYPEVIVLDEPSSNLDAQSIEMLRRVIELLKAQGKTIVISEHRLYYLADLADRFLYLKNGRLISDFSNDEMRALPREELACMGLRELNLDALRSSHITPKQTARPCLPDRYPLINYKNFLCQRNRKTVLDIEGLEIERGSIIAVIGHNGAGKSTFANCLCGLQKHKGNILVDQKPSKRKQRLQKSYMVMQDVNHQLFTESVLEEVTLNTAKGSEPHAEYLLEQLGLSDFKDTHPLALSGGQKQRVAIASALCSGKEFLVYDEPTSGLDYLNMKASCKLIEEASQQCLLSLVVTHDLEFILSCCTSVLHVSQGRILDYYPLDEGGLQKVREHFLLKPQQS